MVTRRPRATSVLLISFAMLCVYVTYQLMDSTSTGWFGCRSRDFVLTLAGRATPDRFVVLALVDGSFADMAINLYESSFKPNNIENFLFVGAGRRACEILLNASLPCFHYREDRDTDVPSVYKSPEFIRKMNIRTDMILDALEAGFTVLHTDLDVVFLKNPLPDLKAIMLTADIATMWDKVAYNAGFAVIRPTWFSKRIYERMQYLTRFSAKTDDQSALNLAIHRMDRSYRGRGFSAVALDKSRYLCGVEYFERGNRLFATACPRCIVVHNNWIVSREAKIYRFKEHLMWRYDKDAYYSNVTQDYLTYANPIVWNDEQTSVAEELEALKGALAIGELLNRVVILPRFHCSNRTIAGAEYPASAKSRTRSPSAVPIVAGEPCPLNSLLNITAFEEVFAGRYRESSFLQHPLVPGDVKRGLSRPHLILAGRHKDLESKLTAGLNDDSGGSKVVVIRPGGDNSNLTLTSEEIVRNLATSGSRVFRFHSLYRATPRFLTLEEQATFEANVKAAFRPGTYRQL